MFFIDNTILCPILQSHEFSNRKNLTNSLHDTFKGYPRASCYQEFQWVSRYPAILMASYYPECAVSLHPFHMVVADCLPFPPALRSFLESSSFCSFPLSYLVVS